MDCFIKISNCSSCVFKTSLTRSKFVSVEFKRNSASCLRECNPVIPAASSSKILRCSGFAAMIAPTRPWLTIEVDLAPVAASANNNCTSFRRTSFPLTRYSEPSPRQIRRVTSISSLWLNKLGALRSILSRSIVTSAISQAGLPEVPLKITSSNSLPRICLGANSPMTNLKASTRFDFPHPLGPTIPVRPFSIIISIGSTNDLKPFTLSFLNLIIN